jgi:spore germination protein GerM
MNRSTLDKLISSIGLVVAVVLIASSCALFYTHNFIHNQVYNQLSAEKIFFPVQGSVGLTSLPALNAQAMSQYAGQQLTTGAQAKVWANDFIAVHLQKIGGGQTYAQLSAASIANPKNAALADQVQLVFRGETLRGLLLNAYAFDTMATVANWAAWGALVSGLLLLLLSILGFNHAGRIKGKRSR